MQIDPGSDEVEPLCGSDVVWYWVVDALVLSRLKVFHTSWNPLCLWGES